MGIRWDAGCGTHPGGWSTGRGHCLPPFQCHNSLTFGDVNGAYRTSGSPSAPTPSLFFFPPSPLSVQVAKRTPAVGCSLSSPTHGQRSLELPQRATAPLAEDSTSQPPERREDTPVFFIPWDFRYKDILVDPPIFFLLIFSNRKREEPVVFNAQPCSSSRLAVRCCPSTTRRSSSSSPAVATCRFLINALAQFRHKSLRSASMQLSPTRNYAQSREVAL